MAEVDLWTAIRLLTVSTDDANGQRTVKMQASVNNLDIKKFGNVSPDVYVTVTLCED